LTIIKEIVDRFLGHIVVYQTTFIVRLSVQSFKLIEQLCFHTVFTARRYASAVYVAICCPSVGLSVCPSHVGIVSKRLV